MQSETAKVRLLGLALMKLLFLLGLSGSASAQQSIEDNIRPVGQVCLAGQSCVGSTVGRAAVAMPASESHAEAAATAAVEEIEPAATGEEVVAVEPAVAAFDVESAYQMSCFACHGTGAADAPKPGDKAVWSERLDKGIDAVMTNVINGLNAMPAKGLCMTCSDSDLRALVDYMVSQ